MVQEIVRRAVGGHSSCLVTLERAHATVVQIPDGDVEEHLHGVPGASYVADILLRIADNSALLGERGRPDVMPQILREDIPFTLLKRRDSDFRETYQVGTDGLFPDCSLIHCNSPRSATMCVRPLRPQNSPTTPGAKPFNQDRRQVKQRIKRRVTKIAYVLTNSQQEWQKEVDDARREEGKPKATILLNVHDSDCKKSTDVDEGVE